jgi:hypothetical protein
MAKAAARAIGAWGLKGGPGTMLTRFLEGSPRLHCKFESRGTNLAPPLNLCATVNLIHISFCVYLANCFGLIACKRDACCHACMLDM